MGGVAIVIGVGVWFESQARQMLVRHQEQLAFALAESAGFRLHPLLAAEDYDGLFVSLREIALRCGCVDVLVANRSGLVLAQITGPGNGSNRADVDLAESMQGRVALPRNEGVWLTGDKELQAWSRLGSAGSATDKASWVRITLSAAPLQSELVRLRGNAVGIVAVGGAVLTMALLLLLTRAYGVAHAREDGLIAQQRELRDAVHRDRLTGLLNRAGLHERLELAVASRRAADRLLAVCFLDLDGFKAINDRFGHAVGDLLLVEVARRLSGCVRESDTVARLGGDEFVLLLEGETRPGELLDLLERILQRVSQQVPGGSQPLRVGVSIGVTLCHSATDTPQNLLEQADEAMYEAKRGGRNRWVLHPSVSGDLFSPAALQSTPS